MSFETIPTYTNGQEGSASGGQSSDSQESGSGAGGSDGTVEPGPTK